MTSYEFMQSLFDLVSVKIKDLYEPNMYATRNFHGQFYLDSDLLNDYLQFRSHSFDDVLNDLKKHLPFSMKFMRFIPKKYIKKRIKIDSEFNPNTPLYWIKHNDTNKINAFFGSMSAWENIPSWSELSHSEPSNHIILNHGYDESKENHKLSIKDMQEAASFRGGSCLSESMVKGDLYTPLEWSCSEGHSFTGSPYLILKAGHWCPHCLKNNWSFNHQSKNNPFFSQLWHLDHEIDENNFYHTSL
jgi:hypothetical protein